MVGIYLVFDESRNINVARRARSFVPIHGVVRDQDAKKARVLRCKVAAVFRVKRNIRRREVCWESRFRAGGREQLSAQRGWGGRERHRRGRGSGKEILRRDGCFTNERGPCVGGRRRGLRGKQRRKAGKTGTTRQEECDQ